MIQVPSPSNSAADNVNVALQQNGYSVTEMPLGDPSGATPSVRIILTTETNVVPGKPATAGLTEAGLCDSPGGGRLGH